MAIKDFEKHHGVVFSRLIHMYEGIKITADINQDNSSYIINDKLGFYIKHSAKRLTPWQFTFKAQHHQSITKLNKLYGNGYVVFVCNSDGICAITFKDYFKLIRDIEDEQIKNISVSRLKNEQYSVSGTDGELEHKIQDNNFQLYCSK